MAASEDPPLWPFPECLPRDRGGPWEIVGSRAPRVEIDEHRMFVPLAGSAVAAGQRAHELAHARWSWRRPARGKARRGIHDDTFQAVEDARIHLRLKTAGVDLSAGIVAGADLAAFRSLFAATPSPLRTAALVLVAAYGTGSFPMILRRCRATALRALHEKHVERAAALEAAMRVAEEAGRRLSVSSPTTLDTLRVARWLEQQFADLDVTEPSPMGCLLHGLEGQAREDTVPWGVLQLDEPPRAIRIAIHGAQGRRRSIDTGTVPRHWHRWVVDGAVFVTSAPRSTGGTVLVDASGSMSLTRSDLARLITGAPTTTIAVYSGLDRSGVLRVLVRDGFRAGDHLMGPPAGPGNVIDKPALEWLARQRGPRVWISDGAVTGIGDHGGEGNARECADMCRRANIRRVRSIAMARGR